MGHSQGRRLKNGWPGSSRTNLQAPLQDELEPALKADSRSSVLPFKRMTSEAPLTCLWSSLPCAKEFVQ
eukprot:3183861-Amphidinium_carterae.1